MSTLNVLFIGGSGIISRWCAERAAANGMNVDIVTRHTGRELPVGANPVTGDIRDPDSISRILDGRAYDVIIDWLVFEPDDVRRDYKLFKGKTGQYVFISSASAYQTPPAHLPVTETTPLSNPFWAYSRAKIECETLLDELNADDYPVTIVRPSHTYDRTMVPFDGGWTAIERMRQGKPVIVPGDGTSLWTMTHSRDFAVGFAGLLGRPEAIGETFHITSETPMTWNYIYDTMAKAAGVQPQFLHVASDSIAAVDEEWGAALLGDKSHSMIFDNSKIRKLVPDFNPTTPFEQGAREIIEWHDADASRRTVDPTIDHAMDLLSAAYQPRGT
jgi:nucleoside-diphosphate-sugar epimerase